MQLIRKLLFRTRPGAGQNRKIRGLSTAELVGIIVIVGILGALGGTYVIGMVDAAKTSTGNQNAQSLNTVMSSAFAAGAIIDDGTHAAGMIDMTAPGTAAVNELCGAGVTVGTPAVTYKMNPPVGTPASYVLSGTDPTTYKFTYTPASGAGP